MALNITAGILDIPQGGTNAGTASGARINLLPSLATNAGKVLAVNAGATDVEFIPVAGGGGTVTSVGLSMPAIFSVANSPITTNGTLAVTYSGTALPVANGGTGATTAGAALTALGAQATLVSGTNIKTINGNSLLGAGDVVISSTAVSNTISIISTNTAAVRYTTYVCTASLTLTLPASPAVGDWIEISNRSSTLTITIARNAQNIMGLAEDMTINILNVGFKLTFADATRGWIII